MKPLVSVIVPCYNVEQYIDRCLNSLVNQTIGIENLQLILVNDASTDCTYDKLLEWEKKFPEQVIVITYEENMRQGAARNLGMQYATADYIGFVDSDDCVELDMYEQLYSIARSGGYDEVRGKFVRENQQDKITVSNERGEDQEYHFQNIKGFYDFNVEEHGHVGEYGSICTGIYKKSCIVDNDIWFPEKIAYEDNYWSQILGLFIKDLYILDKIVYHYFFNPHSTVTTYNAFYHLDRLIIEIQILEKYEELGIFDDFYDELEIGFLQRFYLNTLHIIFTRFTKMPDIYEYMREKILHYFPDFDKKPFYQYLDTQTKMLLDLIKKPGEIHEKELEELQKIYLQNL